MKTIRPLFLAVMCASAIAMLSPAPSLQAAPAGPVPDSTGLLTPWRLEPAAPCVHDSAFMIVRGFVATPCDSFIGAEAITPLFVRIRTQVNVDRLCFAGPSIFYGVPVPLGRFAAGPHMGIVEVETILMRSDGSSTRQAQQHRFDFVVAAECSIPPPPAPGPLPYVERITVGRAGLCGPEPICPEDSIEVAVSGFFPHDCFSFRRLQVIPSPATVFPPLPPTVRIIVDDGGCLGRPCYNVQVPWSASVKLPPMGARDYLLSVELAQVTCSDTYPPGQLYGASVPFRVAGSCPSPPACLNVDFAPGDLSVCNATVATGRPAELTFLVRPTVALAGLQGEFKLDPPVLNVTRIDAIGPAQGMLLEWTATVDGARFVLFARSGAPIPPIPLRDTRGIAFGGWPVLRVTVEHLMRGGPPPERTVVTTENILGADIDGGAVLLCLPPPCVDADPRFSSGRALICGERACDFNSDGLQDVRDLVLMVRCANGEGACPPDAGLRFDCDRDGTFAIADVICCARNVLQRPPCPDCPPDTGQVRPEPGVAVTFGAPQESAGGIALPVLITGADRLGAAMLTLEAPLDRYDVTGFDVTGFDVDGPGNWLALHEVRDGRLILGLIEIRGGPRGLPVERQFTLMLALRPGQPSGGQVTVVGGEFSGPDGVTLAVELGRPTQTLPGGAQMALGQNQPNPFSTETAFTLQIAEAADVVVGIYDLRGRAVADLHRAPLTPGPHTFRWDGRRSDGSAAPNGVYFYQATVGGKTAARKLILMRGN